MKNKSNKSDKMSLRFVIPLVLFFLGVGALLIWLESMVTIIASYALSAVMLVCGVWLLIRYLRSDPEARIAGKDLALGLILVLAGVLLVFNPTDMDRIFPRLWGLSLVFGGFLKIQYAFDEKTVGVKRWWLMLVFAAVSLIIGILALLSESFFGTNQNLIIGIFMLGEAILDLVTFFLIKHGLKKMNAEKEAILLAAQAAANLPAETAAEEPEPAPAEEPQEE